MRIVLWLYLSLLARIPGGAYSFVSKIRTTRPLSSLLTRSAEDPVKVVVVGGGWAGFAAADAISTAVSRSESRNQAVEVELLDASPRGGGLAGGWRTPKLKRPVEAGIHGFWRDYLNTFDTVRNRIGLNLDDVLTEYTPSMLVSESGKVALAPVLGEGMLDYDEKKAMDEISSIKSQDLLRPELLLSRFAKLLPPPLDIALLSEFNPDNPLNLLDRASAIGLLGIWADFEQEDPKSWERYDKMSAEALFRSSAGVSQALYRELVSPLLHVLPMTPGYDCSAAAALSCFHVFALQSKGAFDVRWCRGTISEKIFGPWEEVLNGRKVRFRGSAKVTAMEKTGSKKYTVTVNGEEKIECDAVVMAVGGTAMKRLLPSCQPLAKVANRWNEFRGVTCVAVRLFLKPMVSEDGSISLPSTVARAMEESPVVVCGPNVGKIRKLVETGFCIYDLTRLQDEFKQSSPESAPCAALEIDFFRADVIADLKNDEVVALALQAVSAALEIGPIDPALVLDSSVFRARDAVSHFCVNSASWSPRPKLADGLYCCGDWIDRTGHASWSTEKAVVTARQAAAALADDFGLVCDTEVIPVASDTPQLDALRKLSRAVRSATPQDVIPLAPWVLAKQIQGR